MINRIKVSVGGCVRLFFLRGHKSRPNSRLTLEPANVQKFTTVQVQQAACYIDKWSPRVWYAQQLSAFFAYLMKDIEWETYCRLI